MNARVIGKKIHIGEDIYDIANHVEVNIIPLNGEIPHIGHVPDGEYRVIYEEDIKTGVFTITGKLGDFTISTGDVL